MHWSKQERERKTFQEMAWAVLSEKGNRCPRGLERIDLHAVLMFPEKRRRDVSNFGAVLWKLFLDALVREGVIPDDTAEYVTCHEPKIMTGGRALTVITLEAGRHSP
jgi:Holliday junction resolvase RusA-like endonuclease